MASRDIVKPYFETGDKPTQAQFYQFFDLVRFLDDPIALNQVTSLVTALGLKADKSDFEGQLIAYDAQATYVIPAGYLLEKMIVFYGAPGNMYLSLNAYGDTDIAEMLDVQAGWNNSFVLDLFAEADTNLYIDGIPAGSKIVFIKRKIKTA